jgi:tetratricopeptide (TPR) repeat protein
MGEMTPEDQEERTLEVLKLKIRQHVRTTGSTQGKFEKEFAYDGWFQQLGSRRVRLKTSTLYKVLRALKIDPLDFFAEVFGRNVEPKSDTELSAPGLGPDGNQIAAVRWAEKAKDPPADGARVAGIKAWLERLDDERYTEPAKVAEEIQAALEEGEFPREGIPLCLGVQGSCYRLMLEYAKAEEHIRQGLDYAEEVLEALDVARLHTRLATISISLGKLEVAAQENSMAYRLHKEEGDQRGMAEALVTQGAILGLEGEFDRSTATFEEALRKLNSSNPRYRAAALGGIARNMSMTGNAAEGIDYAKKAVLVPTYPSWHLNIRWTYGDLLCKAGRGQEGLKELGEVVSKLSQRWPLDACFAALDFCSELIRSGKPKEAHRAARQLVELSGPVGEVSKSAREVVVELAAIGARGEGLSIDTLQELRRRAGTKVGPHPEEGRGQRPLHPEEGRGQLSLHPEDRRGQLSLHPE